MFMGFLLRNISRAVQTQQSGAEMGRGHHCSLAPQAPLSSTEADPGLILRSASPGRLRKGIIGTTQGQEKYAVK